MKLMKFFKNIFLLVMIFLFIAAGVLLQSSIVVKNTLFSEDYFQRKIDENHINNNIEKLAKEVIDNSEKFMAIKNTEKEPIEVTQEAQAFIDSYKTTMTENIDVDLIKLETLKTINGLYGYFLLGNEKLPIINIKPIKEIYINLLVQQIIITSDQKISSQIDQIVPYVKFVSRLYPRDTVINELMNLEQVKTMGLSREVISTVVSKIVNSDNIKSEELYNYIATEIIRDRLDFYEVNEIKDELDLNLLFNIKYGDEYNPVGGAAKMFNDIKRDAILAIGISYILLFLTIAITAYSIKSILRWLGVGILCSGVVGMMSYRLSRIVNSDIILYYEGVNLDVKGLDMSFMQNWILSYINGLWKGMFICAAIFTTLGAIFIVSSFFIYKLFKGESNYKYIHQKSSKKASIMALRVVAVLILLTAISVNITFNISSIRNSVDEYNKVKEKAKVNAMDTNETLGKVLNAEKLMNTIK